MMEVLWLKTKKDLEVKVKLVWRELVFGVPLEIQPSLYMQMNAVARTSVQQWLLFPLQFLSLSDLVINPYFDYIHSF